jgi:2-dehydro-3-deoxyphosphogluconate aldolase/(4S)-4-hydroxy-2-oxoglutarate aldolase
LIIPHREQHPSLCLEWRWLACGDGINCLRDGPMIRGKGEIVTILETILKRRVVPAATIQSEDTAVPLAEAMLKGGLDIIEVTFRTAAAEGAIRAIVKRFPEMIVGAGTVLTTQQAQQAADAGCRFAVAPGLNEIVVAKAKSCGLLHIPGVITPTEIEAGMALGCEFLKFFPADAMGGAKTLKALAGPYDHTGVK